MPAPDSHQPALRPLNQSPVAGRATWAAIAIAPLASLAGLAALAAQTETTWVRVLLLIACGILLVVAGVLLGLAIRAATTPGQARPHLRPLRDDDDGH